MGLDTVELVMDIEEAFGVSIPDAAAEKMVCLGDTVDWLMRELSGHQCPAALCPEARQFRRLRQELLRVGIGWPRLRPSETVARIVTSPAGIAAWPAVLERLELPEDPRRRHHDHRRGFIGGFGPVAHARLTLGELSRRLAMRHDHAAIWVRGRLSRQRVFARLCLLVAETMAIDPEALTERTRYIQDLGMD